MPILRPALLVSTLAAACQACLAQSAYAPSMGEYSWSNTVRQLSMRNVHAQGIQGTGVVVGVLDTGLDSTHQEFANSGRLMAGYNAVDGSSNITDSSGHGTHVTGILAASGNGVGMYGVAPMATILPVKIFKGETAPSSAINRGIDYAVSRGARVINLSLGAPSPTGDASLRMAASANNTVIVVAAGNESARTPSWPARYAKEAWANGTIIVVGAVDSNKRLSTYSNRAGDTAMQYLVAPGISILSSSGGTYIYMSGTSMATPAVSGAAALVTGYWPYLRASQVAAILLNTADDLGAPGVDAVFGRGMLNVNRALAPIGSYTYRSANGTRATVALGTAGVSSSRPAVATPSAFADLQTEVFDDYGRNFTSHEGTLLAVRSAMTLDSVMGAPNMLLDATQNMLASGTSLTQYWAHSHSHMDTATATRLQALRGEAGERADRPLTGVAQQGSLVRLNWPGGLSLSAGDGGLAGGSLGLQGSPLATRLAGTEGVLANPLLGFAPDHRFAATSLQLAPGWRASAALVDGHAERAASGTVHVAEISREQPHGVWQVALSQLREQGLLGGYSTPAMGLAQATQTVGVSASGAWALDGHWALAGTLSQAVTTAPRATGMLSRATPIVSQSAGVGLVRADTWRAGDRLSLAVQAPLRARSGTLTYTMASGVTAEGEPIYTRQRVNLAQGGQEWRLESRYSVRLNERASLSAALVWRLNPDHDAQAPSQVAAGVRLNLGF